MRDPKKYIWTDSTSYSRDSKDRTPTSWTVHFHGIRVSVWKSRYEENAYECACHGSFTLERSLDAKTPEEAREEALALVYEEIRKVFGDIEQNIAKVELQVR